MIDDFRTLAAIGCLTLCLCARADLPVPPESFDRAETPGMSISDDGALRGATWKEDGGIAAEPSAKVDGSPAAGDGVERIPISLSVGVMLTWFWTMASGAFVLLWLSGLLWRWFLRRKGAKK